MALTETEAHAVRRLLSGLNPRVTAGRPNAQAVYEAVLLLAERAGKVLGLTPLPDQDERLRQLVDDLYRVQPADEQAIAVISWHFRSRPNVVELIEAIASVSGGTVHGRDVDADHDYVLVLSRQPLDDATALKAWEASQ